jgi:hypothetical protein
VIVGVCFLVATFTFAIGSALIHSHFSSGTSGDGTLVAGVFLLACIGLAVVTNGLAMRSVLTPHTRLRSQAWSWLVPRNVSMLGLIGYPVFLVGTTNPVTQAPWLRTPESRQSPEAVPPVGTHGAEACVCKRPASTESPP